MSAPRKIINETAWPQEYLPVVECLGEAHAFHLTRLIPGINLTIPKLNPNTSSNFAWNYLPEPLRACLFQHFAGDRIYIPFLHKQRERALLDAIDALGSEGASVQEIAIRLGVGEETVYHFRRNRKLIGQQKTRLLIDPNQLNLFE